MKKDTACNGQCNFDFEQLVCRLRAQSSEKTRQFNVKTAVTTTTVLGVKVPCLRLIAKEYAGYEKQLFDSIPNNAYYETDLLKSILVGNIKCALDEKLQMMDSMKESIDNWAVCDTLTLGIKIKGKEEIIWQYCLENLCSRYVFCRRLSLVLILSCLSGSADYIDKIFTLLQGLDCYGDYYFDMAAAWLISVCFVHFPERTLTFLKLQCLPKFVQNKAIAKTCESYRVASGHKIAAKALKKVT